MSPAIAAVLSVLVLAQANAPEFGAASIKPSQLYRAGGEGSGQERVAVSATGVTMTNASLSFCIQWAYNVRFYQVSGPDRITEDRYNVIAKTARPVSKEELMSMMQTLLSDRFKLKLHRDIRSLPVYELIATGKFRKISPAAPGDPKALLVLNGSFVFGHMTMPEFAAQLSGFSAFDRPVIDKTGIEGAFNITLDSAAQAMRADPSSIFAALESVGLRLDNGKKPMEVLVVDHAEKPSEN